MSHVRKAAARAHHYLLAAQRLPVVVALGCLLVLGSHWLSDRDERAWARDAGAGIVTFAFARWLANQGQMRRDAQGRPLRTQTMRIGAEDAERIRRYYEHGGERQR